MRDNKKYVNTEHKEFFDLYKKKIRIELETYEGETESLIADSFIVAYNLEQEAKQNGKFTPEKR